MVPCCRRHHPWRRKTFLDNSEFLRFRPAPTPTSLHNLKAAHLATISKDIHTDSQLQVGKTRKTAVLGRIRNTPILEQMVHSLRRVSVYSAALATSKLPISSGSRVGKKCHPVKKHQ